MVAAGNPAPATTKGDAHGRQQLAEIPHRGWDSVGYGTGKIPETGQGSRWGNSGMAVTRRLNPAGCVLERGQMPGNVTGPRRRDQNGETGDHPLAIAQ